MHRSSFTSNETGILVPTIQNQYAFVPAPLPPPLDFATIATCVGEALQKLGELKGACRRLTNPYILVRPLQRNEALTSSAMEGTFTTDSHLLLAEAGLETDSDDSTREVVNYLNALNASLEMLASLPISHRVIKKGHEILLSGLSSTRGAQKRPGEYKRDQNWIGGRTIDGARYVPPPPAETQKCMDDLEAYLNRDTEASAFKKLIDLALVHYQIEAIHPFADGNGRMGRMLISLMAVHNGLLDMPILYISPAMEHHKDEYIDRMFNVSAKGEWASWIHFFCERICETCTSVIVAIDRIISLHENFRALASKSSRSSNPLIIIDSLFERPVITVSEAAEKLNVTYAAAKGTIDKLIELGIVEELPGLYPKAYYSPTIMHVSRPDPLTEAEVR
ncbi:Fic family protein [Agrobacterium larrymoorei]|uniref:Fic family protein n=1 Tax=Agrobacterium larrymoorei TaxID=160699 RepID=A0A4D7DW15_9HYPH|nr:Fic family protein [Agrobacterium larrymoorei]QCI98869.1 Fic family protein [Agrobacterium larrymoorei]QYA08243.1 Fic family protein [Agrobacterium larrymoorei]WHA40969.1 Fic family protein [Agrobacterium larrymoorei]